MQLLDRVRQTIRRHNLAAADTRIVVALSGGSDSVALAHLLRLLDAAGDLRVVGVAHFNHQLRSAADEDEAFCAALSSELNWPFFAGRDDVAARARRERRSVEDAARHARHEFFALARTHFDADRVAVGHTRDDQAETYLLRILRGAGPRGLAGMHPQREFIIRPLLECRRGDLRRFLSAQACAWREDESNADISIPRNRVRSELLPFLEQRFNPGIVDVLADEAEIARADWAHLDHEAETLTARVCEHDGTTCRIDARLLAEAPPAVARIVLRRAMMLVGGHRPIAFEHVESALHLARNDGGRFDAPGQTVERTGSIVVLTSKEARKPLPGEPFCWPLPIPGAVVGASGWRLTVEEASSAAAFAGAEMRNPAVAVLQRDRCRGPLAVRSWQPGDRFRPLGLNGRKKLQDFFTDRKVARAERGRVPIVVDADGQILWVAGLAIDDEFRVTDPAQAVLVLRLMVSGGFA